VASPDKTPLINLDKEEKMPWNSVLRGAWYLGLMTLIAFAFYSWASAPPPTPTIQLRPDCATMPGLPWDVVVCPDKHAYHIESGRWVDMGRVTPLPPTPRNRGLIQWQRNEKATEYSAPLSALAKRYTGSKGHPVYCDEEAKGTYGW